MKAALSHSHSLNWLPPKRCPSQEQYEYGYNFGMRFFHYALDLLDKDFELVRFQKETDSISKQINFKSVSGEGFLASARYMRELTKELWAK